MGAEDEFRKVAEDVRELARTLRQELRNAQKEARDTARGVRDDYRAHRFGDQTDWQSPRPPRPPRAPRPPRPPRHGGRPGWYSGWEQPTSAGPPPASDAAAPQTYGWQPGYGAPPAWLNRPARPPKPVTQRPPIRHKHDGSTLISLILVVVGLAWLATQTHMFDVSLEAVLAVALAILGAGMVITARTDWNLSRRHWPMWVGAGLLVVLVAATNTSKIGDSLSSLNFGPENFTPTTWDNAKGQIDNFAGPIKVDLTSLTGSLTQNETLRVRDTFGPITVIVPQALTTRVHVIAHTVFGPASVPNPTANGSHGDQTADLGPSSQFAVTLDLRTVFGPVTVKTQAPATQAIV